MTSSQVVKVYKNTGIMKKKHDWFCVFKSAADLNSDSKALFIIIVVVIN